MRKLNKFLVIGLALVLTALPVLAMAQSFSDVSDHWSKQYVDYVADKGWVNGYPDGTFGPEGNITNAEFAALINRVAKLEGKAIINYTDVPENEWYRSAVETGVASGYLSNQGEFRPNEPISREEVARIIGVIYSLNGKEATLDAFTDAKDITDANRKFVAALVELKIITGYPEGDFLPKNFIKRGEMAAMLYRMFENQANVFNKDLAVKPVAPVNPKPPVVAGGNWNWGYPTLPVYPVNPNTGTTTDKPDDNDEKEPVKPDPGNPEESDKAVTGIDWYSKGVGLQDQEFGSFKLEDAHINSNYADKEKAAYYTVTYTPDINSFNSFLSPQIVKEINTIMAEMKQDNIPSLIKTSDLTKIGFETEVLMLSKVKEVTVKLYDENGEKLLETVDNVEVTHK